HLAVLEADAEDARAVDRRHGVHVVGPAHGRIDDEVRPPLRVQLALVRRNGVTVGWRVGMQVDEHARSFYGMISRTTCDGCWSSSGQAGDTGAGWAKRAARRNSASGIARPCMVRSARISPITVENLKP